MRIIFYDAKDANNIPCRHYLNLDRVDCFTFSEKDGVTLVYAVMGDDVHTLNETKKIENVSSVVAYLMTLSDRSRVAMSEIIDLCNADAKKVMKGKRFSS
jgi:hypothetical protein